MEKLKLGISAESLLGEADAAELQIEEIADNLHVIFILVHVA